MASPCHGSPILGLRRPQRRRQRWSVPRSLVDTVRSHPYPLLYRCPRHQVADHQSSIFPVHMMTPTWVFPAYPLLLTAPLASNLLDSASRSGHQLSVDRAAMAFGAATTQGTGCLIAFMISAAFMYRLMTQKLPRDMQRPGVVSGFHPSWPYVMLTILQFISIGPFGFTAAGIGKPPFYFTHSFLKIISADLSQRASAAKLNPSYPTTNSGFPTPLL